MVDLLVTISRKNGLIYAIIIEKKNQQRINNTPSGSGAKAVKKAYAYASFLEFLNPTLQRRQTQGNYTDNDDNNLDTQQTNNEPDDLETSSLYQSPNPEASLQHDENIILNAEATKKSTKKDIPQQILNILERRVPQPPATKAPIENDDIKFLLSFRGYMSKMSPNQKFDFKIEMLQLVKRISNSESSYSRPSSSCSNSNPSLSYISIPSPSPANYSQAPSPLLVRRIQDHRESPYSRATTQFRNLNPDTSTSTSFNSFQVPPSSPIRQYDILRPVTYIRNSVSEFRFEILFRDSVNISHTYVCFRSE
ncbi:uncharacterized protein LOC126381195 [Pectinophora gossypiella]|uniref:uncharacterized protein LOC126376788 n=1 Tax=Pectinophora gossypiella TaxID=13191 RepID=UPI00214F138C|nr:uncharacterized protein LOC126376788 [Pectinophora gossypiella]XP_049886669.1 uncharacterized protein LOC126381195 [Pectinophora gossypiella]